MKLTKTILALTAPGLSMLFPIPAMADEDDDWFADAEKEYADFVKATNNEYNSFRDKVNKEYADFMAKPWTPISTIDPLPAPTLPEPGPRRYPDLPKSSGEDEQPIEIIKTIPRPEPSPRPQPLEPIEPSLILPGVSPIKMEMYGTQFEIPGADLNNFHISSSSPSGFAKGWTQLAGSAMNNLISGCLDVRRELNLPDWHYFLLTDAVAEKFVPRKSNQHTLLMGFLLNQSGYDIRFVCEQGSGKLHLIFASTGAFYQRPYYNLNTGVYYAYTSPSGPVTVCDFSTPGETKLSTDIPGLPNLAFAAGQHREIDVYDHPDLKLRITTNRNLIDFLADYPLAALGNTEDSRWSVYADLPASDQIRREIYPALQQAVKGLSQYEAVDLLLKVAQSFPYKYDDEVWGYDRTFFMDESWHYPYSDCEDHAINLSHLVKDILGLQTALVVYPGHMAAAVAITDGSGRGSYLNFEGKRYTLCDATYFYAPAGEIADSYQNKKATLIPVK